ncbi:MAG: threonine synthase [Kiritimatiellae bacterium]|nr:threonine synthase [Kiritimatiellia bacterium]
MKFVSTRKGLPATGPESVFRGLAPDGGLYVPVLDKCAPKDPISSCETLKEAEDFVLSSLFGDFPEEVRNAAVERLLSRFPAENPIPLVDADGFKILELFHGKTGAFKDVALSMLPVFMRHAAGGRRVLVLTATSGDTGSAAMQGFAGVEGTEVAVFFPNVGTSRIQRLQMTTPSDANVHAIAIRGNFDDAQAAVKRIFADRSINELAAARGVTLSSANSINTGRLIPQIGYYIMASSILRRQGAGTPESPCVPYDVVVPSGNFGNILAAYYAKLLGAGIGKFVVASNVNDVLARFVKTGVYDPGDRFTVTNSPSMDIRKSSNVERLLWLLNGGLDGDVERACAETSRLMDDLSAKGRYELSPDAKARLFADFEGGVATPEETEEEMRGVRARSGCVLDPHTAVATSVARRLGYPKSRPTVIAATATPYKFPETCARAFGEDVLKNPPQGFRDLETLPIAQNRVCDVDGMDSEVTRLF